MLPAVDSPLSKPFFRRNTGVSCNTIGVAIKEIQSSLALATSIIDGTSDTYFSMIDGHRCKSTIYFKCGRLKYSHVKEEWSILHRPIHACNNTMKNTATSHHSIAMVIASICPVSAPTQYVVHSTTEESNMNTRIAQARRLSKNLERRHCNLNEDEYETYAIDTGGSGGMNNIEVDHKKIQSTRAGSIPPSSTPKAWLEGQPTPPPVELVRHLLSGAEFISIMSCARRQVETSIQKTKDDVEVNNTEINESMENDNEKSVFFSKTRFWSQPIVRNLKQGEAKLQATIVSLVQAMINASSSSSKPPPSPIIFAEKNDCKIKNPPLAKTLKFIDECIHYAHFHTMELIADWSASWEIRTNLLSEKIETVVEDESKSSSERNTTFCTKSFCTKCVVMSKLAQKGDRNYDRDSHSKKEVAASVSLDTGTTIQEFVKACLAQPWEDIVQSNTRRIGLFQTPFSDCDMRKVSNIYNYNRSLDPEPKRIKVSRWSKVANREPADSLASTCAKQKHNTPAGFAKNEPLVVKKRRRRVRNGLHIACRLPSVLEDTTRTVLRGRSRPIRTNRKDPIDKRNWSDSPTSEIPRTRVRTSDKSTKANKKQITNDNCDVRIEKEKMLVNSRHASDGVKIPRQIQSTKSHGSEDMEEIFSKIQQSKDWNNPRMSKGCNEALSKLSAHIDTAACKNDATWVKQKIEDDTHRHRNNRKQIKSIGSLQQSLSKLSRPITTAQWSPDGLNLGHDSLSESIDHNSFNSDFIERAALENTSLSSIKEARSDDSQNLDQFTQSKKAFQKKAQKPIRGVATIEEMAPQTIECKVVRENNYHLVDQCQDFQLKLAEIKSNKKTYKDTKNLKYDGVITQRDSNEPWVRLSHVVSKHMNWHFHV